MTDCKRKSHFLDDDNDEVEVVAQSAISKGFPFNIITSTYSHVRNFLNSPKKIHTEIKRDSAMNENPRPYKIFQSKNQPKEETRVSNGGPKMATARHYGQLVITSPSNRKPRLSDPNGPSSSTTEIRITNGVDRNCSPTVITKSSPEPVILEEVKGQPKKILPEVNRPHFPFRTSSSFYSTSRLFSPRSSSTPSRTSTPCVQRRGSDSISNTSSPSSSTLKESRNTYSNPNSNINTFRSSRVSTRSQTKYPPTEVTIPSDDDDETEAMETEEPISDQVLLYGSDRCGGNITITRSDLECLRKEQFLNDVILDFYLTWLLDEKIDSKTAKTVHIFSTFFFTKLTQATTPTTSTAATTSNNASPSKQESISERYYSRAKNWLKKVDIFSKKYLIVPVNRKSHWFLLIVCNPGEIPDVEDDELLTLNTSSNKSPCILIFDSLGITRSGGRFRLTDPLRHLLAAEYKAKFGKEKKIDHILLPDRNVKTTCQTNYSDCGLFLLQYVEQFLRDPDLVLSLLSVQGGLKTWVDHSVIDAKRDEIRKLIIKLALKSPASEACVAPLMDSMSPRKKVPSTCMALSEDEDESSKESTKEINRKTKGREVLDVE